MSLTYSSFVTSLANLLVIPSTDANFLTFIPNCIDDSEGRLYRDCDFLRTVTRTSTLVCSTASRNVSLSTDVTWVVVESVNLLSTAGVRSPLPQVSRDYVDAVYPQETSASTATTPSVFAMLTDQTLLVGPAAGQPLNLEVVGTVRPAALSSANSSTYLTQQFADLFLTAACMYGAAYLKNFGAATDDPRSGLSWSAAYQNTLQGVMVEEQRKKSQGPAWTPKSPSPMVERA
jgi:hypothetical protein